MIRLFLFFLLCIASVVASDETPTIPTFSHHALQEVLEEKPSQAMCFVTGDFQGSGVLVSLNGHVGILTAGTLEIQSLFTLWLLTKLLNIQN